MKKYQTLAGLKAAYDSGTLSRENPLVLDNDDTSVWDGAGEVFGAHPEDVLRQALDLLGIPWDTC